MIIIFLQIKISAIFLQKFLLFSNYFLKAQNVALPQNISSSVSRMVTAF